MKTRVLFPILVALLSTVSVLANNATNSVNRTFTKVTQECIVMNETDQAPVKKIVVEKNTNQQMLSKTIYIWNNNAWTPTQQYSYEYNSLQEKMPASFNYSKWSKITGDWEKEQHFDF